MFKAREIGAKKHFELKRLAIPPDSKLGLLCCVLIKLGQLFLPFSSETFVFPFPTYIYTGNGKDKVGAVLTNITPCRRIGEVEV